MIEIISSLIDTAIDITGPDQEYPVFIEGHNRNDLADLLAELGYVKGVEVGVNVGAYSEILCKANPELYLSSIDLWEKPERLKEAQARLAPYNCNLVVARSPQAADLFEDGSLDFVYIDADHKYYPVLRDLASWVPKVRRGGIVAGHDYHTKLPGLNQVIRAVNDYTKNNAIRPWFVLSGEDFPSWFWFKK